MVGQTAAVTTVPVAAVIVVLWFDSVRNSLSLYRSNRALQRMLNATHELLAVRHFLQAQMPGLEEEAYLH